MYKLGAILGIGTEGIVFRIRGYPHLLAKVFYFSRQRRMPVSRTMRLQKKICKQEYRKGKKLRSLGIPVPRYIGVIKVDIPSHIAKTVDRYFRRETAQFFVENRVRSIADAWTESYAVIMEMIESDFSLVSSKRVNHIYQKEIRQAARLGIEIHDSSSALNVLWSKREAKLYFIDFLHWEVPRSPLLARVFQKISLDLDD